MKEKIVILVLIFAFFFSGSYSETVEKQLKTAEKSGFTDALSEETIGFLRKIGVDGISSEKLASLSFMDIANLVFQSFLSKLKEPFKAILSVTACAIICFVMQNLCENFSQTGKVVKAVTAVSVSSIILMPMRNVIQYSSDVIEECSNFMLGFIPVYSSAIVASGNISSAVGFRTLLLSASTVLSRLSSEIILPLICVYIAMCVVSSVSDVNIGEISKTVKNFAVWILTAATTVFSGILGLGTLISSAGDNTFSKTAKLVIGTAIPIVGGTVSDALSTVRGCLEITKNILGAYAIVAIAAIFLPAIVSLLSWKICLSISSGIGDAFGNKSLSSMLSAASAVMGIMLALIAMTSIMFIFSVSIMLMIGVK